MCCCCGDKPINQICALVCAYVLPPLGIFWRFGCGMEFCISLVLTLFGYVPGIIYSCCMIGCKDIDSRGIDFDSMDSDDDTGSRSSA
mmetsp:Transcript_38763/g.77193  ORF Transcript_38763/g.77193 Transcript_38763/m.77193 type:complete len:87 (+) Transcript_38763:69-329(+)